MRVPPGWERVDARPWRSKLEARWRHSSGWRLEHCGHPTAHWPWALFAPDGAMHCTGALAPNFEPAHGTAWPDLASAFAYVDAVLSGAWTRERDAYAWAVRR